MGVSPTADNYIKHPLISYIVVPEHGRWVNKASKVGSKQGLCTTKRDNRSLGEEMDGW